MSKEDTDMNAKTLVLGIVMCGMVSFGTYFLLPPPQDALAQSCATKSDVKRAINYCMDGARIIGGRISTYC